MALFRLVWERKPLHAVPVCLVLALSVVQYGFWFGSPADKAWNLSLWPYAALLAVPLYLLALVKRRQWWVLILTPFMMPYVTAQGYVPAFYGAAGLSRWVLYAIFALGWILLLWRIAVWQL